MFASPLPELQFLGDPLPKEFWPAARELVTRNIGLTGVPTFKEGGETRSAYLAVRVQDPNVIGGKPWLILVFSTAPYVLSGSEELLPPEGRILETRHLGYLQIPEEW